MPDGSSYYLFDADHIVGHADMDTQHRRMVHLLAAAADAVHRGADRNAAQRLFDEYVAYTHLHFSNEERLMQQQCYAQREQHMAVHATLLRQLGTLQQNFRDDPEVVLAAAYEWLMAHIERLDKDLGAFLCEGAVSPV